MSALTYKRVVLVGSWDETRIYRELLPDFQELQLQAVVGGGEASALLGAPRVYGSVDELLRRGCVPHLALICSASWDHAGHASALLRAGVDVLVEPPLAEDPHEADRVAELAERNGRVAVTGAPFRALPALREARRLIELGRIGRLSGVHCDLSHKRAIPLDAPTDGIWQQEGPHAIDVVETLAGPALRIRMLSSSSSPSGEVTDEVEVEVEHEAGLVSRVSLTWREQRSAPIARCIGARGELEIGRAQTILRTETGDETLPNGLYSKTEAYREVLRDFLASCRAIERPVDHGAQSVAWLHAACRSLERGGTWELC